LAGSIRSGPPGHPVKMHKKQATDYQKFMQFDEKNFLIFY